MVCRRLHWYLHNKRQGEHDYSCRCAIVSHDCDGAWMVKLLFMTTKWQLYYVTVPKFWKTDHFVTFDIIYISVYLRHYYWFNKWLNQSHTT